MKRFFQSEAGAAVLWVVSTVLLAATISPWLYQAGKALAEISEIHDRSALTEWLGSACRRAHFSRYFGRSLAISAVVLLPFLFHRIRGIRADAGVVEEAALRRVSWASVLFQIAVGCVIAGGILWAMGAVLESLGAYVPKSDVPGIGKIVSRILPAAIGASLSEEWLFRGLLLGLWLKFSKPLVACLGTSLFFALVHFLRAPDGAVIVAPEAPLAGFELLGKILLHFTNPQFFITDFATLFVIGMLLAAARVRTGALWFSIGLHAGWILAFKAFNMIYQSVPAHPLRPWGVGDTLRSGLFPLLALGLTAVICHWVLKRLETRRALN
jgi:membrane protease YdiL (CAAX protease family)